MSERIPISFPESRPGAGSWSRDLRCLLGPRLGAAFALAAVLQGCTVLPDWASPVAWFQDEVPPPTRVTVDDDSYVDSFPNLASVPDSPPPITPPDRRQRLFAGLEADRRHAEYTAGAPSPATVPDRPAAAEPARPADRPLALPDLEYVAVIYFDVGSSTLSERDRQVLRDVAALLSERSEHVRVVGHASGGVGRGASAGPDLDNFEVSLRRANAVAAELVALGVSPGRVEAVAMSDNEPVYYEFTPTGEAGNRRAEIFFVPQDGPPVT